MTELINHYIDKEFIDYLIENGIDNENYSISFESSGINSCNAFFKNKKTGIVTQSNFGLSRDKEKKNASLIGYDVYFIKKKSGIPAPTNEIQTLISEFINEVKINLVEVVSRDDKEVQLEKYTEFLQKRFGWEFVISYDANTNIIIVIIPELESKDDITKVITENAKYLKITLPMLVVWYNDEVPETTTHALNRQVIQEIDLTVLPHQVVVYRELSHIVLKLIETTSPPKDIIVALKQHIENLVNEKFPEREHILSFIIEYPFGKDGFEIPATKKPSNP